MITDVLVIVLMPLAIYAVGRFLFRGEFAGRNRVVTEFAAWGIFCTALTAALDLSLPIALALMLVGLALAVARERLAV